MADQIKKTGRGGARPGSGRPSNVNREEFDRLLKKAIPPATVEAILTNLGIEALSGNLKATQLVLAYMVGLPIQRQEITGEDGGPQKIVVEYVDESPSPNGDE